MTSTHHRGIIRITRALTAAGLAGVGVITADVPASIVSPNQLQPLTGLRIETGSTAALASAPSGVDGVSFTTVTAIPGAASVVSIPWLIA